jgi:hypothetical protein
MSRFVGLVLTLVTLSAAGAQDAPVTLLKDGVARAVIVVPGLNPSRATRLTTKLTCRDRAVHLRILIVYVSGASGRGSDRMADLPPSTR